MANETKDYLGDGVYADIHEPGGLVLTTEDGISVSNTIYLEPEVYAALVRYVQRMTTEGKLLR